MRASLSVLYQEIVARNRWETDKSRGLKTKKLERRRRGITSIMAQWPKGAEVSMWQDVKFTTVHMQSYV